MDGIIWNFSKKTSDLVGTGSPLKEYLMFLIWFELIGAKAVLPPSEMIFLPTNLFLDHLCSQLNPAAGAHSTFGHNKGVLPKNWECNRLTEKLFRCASIS